MARSVYEALLRWYDERSPVERTRAVRSGRASTFYALGRYNQAAAIADSLLSEHPEDINYLGLSGVAAARNGDRKKAGEIAERLRSMNPQYLFGLHTQQRAFIAAAGRDRHTAVELLRQALSEGRPFDLWLHRHPDLLSLRGYAPFEALRQARK